MNPVLLGGSLLAPAIVAAAKSIPAAHLARFGLIRAPLLGLGPACGAFLGGAATVALLVPGSRGWLKDQALRAFNYVKEWNLEESEDPAASSEERLSRKEQKRVERQREAEAG